MDMNSFRQRQQEREIKRRRQKKNRIILVCALMLLIAAAAIGLNACKSGIVRDGSVAEVEIAQGQSTKAIAALLKENGLISSTSGFVRDVEKSEYANSLRYGIYRIERGMTNDEIIKLLTTGGNVKTTVTVTIPEGFSLERIIERVCELGLSDSDAMYAAAEADYDYDFLDSIPSDSKIKHRLQGFLFPSTYEFEKDADAKSIINTMLAEFDRQIKKEGISSRDLFEKVTLASIVEREAKLDEERAKIAGVIENRIKKGMRLQVDATVVYAISDGMYNVNRVLYKDLEVDSPYNTYKYSGLPVGPICSPGIKSIKAAVSPEKNNFYYYRTDSEKADGSHVFTETFDEHKNAS